ncbi:MAG: LysM peptidoglycan-binding domain-containing protein [Anaerohalosphaeraceae bacterium]|nr:LysM peptidoglycan-binding domain-containing protein [Anaerohalosphaeraceae bacterium]
MRKDVKTGMFIGTGLCLVGLVWFCAEQRISLSPGPRPGRDIEKIVEAPVTVYEPPRLPQKAIAPAPPKQPKVVTSPASVRMAVHTVKPGQTLSDISKIYYNTTQNWKKIYEANRQKFPKGPNAIKTGIKLVIPE